MSEPDTEPELCDHHEHQVAVRIVQVEDSGEDWVCSWCSDPNVALLLEKSRRHAMALCDECLQVISILDLERFA